MSADTSVLFPSGKLPTRKQLQEILDAAELPLQLPEEFEPASYEEGMYVGQLDGKDAGSEYFRHEKEKPLRVSLTTSARDTRSFTAQLILAAAFAQAGGGTVDLDAAVLNAEDAMKLAHDAYARFREKQDVWALIASTKSSVKKAPPAKAPKGAGKPLTPSGKKTGRPKE